MTRERQASEGEIKDALEAISRGQEPVEFLKTDIKWSSKERMLWLWASTNPELIFNNFGTLIEFVSDIFIRLPLSEGSLNDVAKFPLESLSAEKTILSSDIATRLTNRWPEEEKPKIMATYILGEMIMLCTDDWLSSIKSWQQLDVMMSKVIAAKN